MSTNNPISTPAAWLLGAAMAAAAATAGAATTQIAPAPLITSAPLSVLPNLMFVLDDSGSMSWTYMPDWVIDQHCRSAGATYSSTGSFNLSCNGLPLFKSSDFNGMAYNPGVTYRPPVDAAGASYPNQTSANTTGWTSVKNDAYGIQSSTSINLLTGFADVEWCTDTNYTDCLRDGNYVLPGTVNSKAYTSGRYTTANGTAGNIAIGAPDAPTTSARTWGPHYYTITPGEFCTTNTLRDCQTAQNTTYSIPAPLRWCNSDANSRASAPAANACQATKTSTFAYARFPTKFFTAGTAGVAVQPATSAKATFDLVLTGSPTCNNSNKVAISAVTVNGVDLLKGVTTSFEKSQNNLASDVAGGINNKTAITGYTATASSNTVVITAPAAWGNVTYAVALTRAAGSSASCLSSTSPASVKFSGGTNLVPAVPAVPAGWYGSFTRVEIVPTVTSYAKATTRSDCVGSSCTYAEEMTNFANWWTYYHTRMQAMKSSTALAFSAVSDQFRVGYTSINNNTTKDFLNIDQFTAAQKTSWFSKLTKASPNNSTPLRTALATVGRLYAGKLNGTSYRGSTVADPMQYSCQQNFTLLSTDGYWNEATDPVRIDGTTAIGDQDHALPRPYYDGVATANSLSDVAAYYYNTDLRVPAGSATTCPNSSGVDLCENNVPTGGVDVAQHQHMTTFTLGLGASGFMQFIPDYATTNSGDYFDVKNGTGANPAGGTCVWIASGACNWPTPVGDTLTAIDDLWHAAVNGRGTYFSAKDPATMYTGLTTALANIKEQTGGAAAATTSNPNVSAGDNFVFSSTFVSQEWSGELVRQQVDLVTGDVSKTKDWAAQSSLDTNTSRSIWTYAPAASTKLKPFQWSSLTTTEQSYFQTANITATGRALSQFCSFGVTCLSTASQSDAAGAKLVAYLLGNRTDEGPAIDISKYYRERAHLLGDIVNSEAVYVKVPPYAYADDTYSTFKTSMAARQSMVYVGANDGMLHAFNASTGSEVWAYVPSLLMPNLYRLADKDYANRHQYYVDGTPTVGDVKLSDGTWHTILVGGLGAGGRGYYALDVTDPANPKGLWEFTYDTSAGTGYTKDANLGLTFGRPEITKLSDGTWTVIMPSGYNNVAPGDGHGHLYVLNAQTGAMIRDIDTSTGSAGTPSGLAQIRAWVDNTDVDNTTLRVYGGDVLGNVWRFDVNNITGLGAAGYDAQLLATLRGSSGNVQPVTARPEIGLAGGNAMVYVGTGKYLGLGDLSDTSPQSIYGIKDTLAATNWGVPRDDTRFIQQTFTDTTCPAAAVDAKICTAGQAVRTLTNNAVNLATDHGWYVDLPPGKGERANSDPQLALGTLTFTTNIISGTGACEVGGDSFINFFNYATGGPVPTAQAVGSVKLGKALATRPVLVRLPNGKVISLTRMSDGTTVASPVPVDKTSGGTHRLSWRELTTEQ